MSIVGADQLPESGYLRAKVAQEKLITESDMPYSIVRATQFAEFTDAIAATMTVGDEVRVPDTLARNGQTKRVVVDPDVGYFGTSLSKDSLVVT